MIDYSVDGDGIATILWDMADRSMNVLNEPSMTAFAEAVRRALADPAAKGVIITSSKGDFIAGADLAMLQREGDPRRLLERGLEMQRLFRDIEKAGKPFVAAINGTALGGGYEICLACHGRIAADRPQAKIGLPEVLVGLMPGGGGTQRLPRMIGVRAALPFLLEGRKVDPKRALENGMVDRVVPPGELLAEARRWLREEGPKALAKPWDRRGFKLPDGPIQSPKGYETFVAGNAMLHDRTFGNYPAPLNIMSAVYEGCQVDIDTAVRIETRYFVNCATSPQAKNMIRSLFFSMGEANKLARRPQGVPKASFSKVGVLGAGMMGGAIAYLAAEAGLEVVLLDTTPEQAEKGKAYGRAIWDRKLSQKRLGAQERDARLARIRPTTDFADLAGCELVVEAVFEDRRIKAEVTAKAEAVLGADAVFASNTSTLPITGLAQASARPETFIGMHFFSPADKMPLVEIIRAERTGDACLARAMDFVKRIGKTPIVVNDSRGFYTSRVFATYVAEGLGMLAEGVAPALIENAGRMAGMPVGPLALADEVSLELMHRVQTQTRADLGDAYRPSPADPVVLRMVEALGRIGKKSGKGFYDYPAEGGKRLWPGLAGQFPAAAEQPSVEEVMRRLMYVQSVETARCLEEQVVTDPRDADIGSILGWGFAPFHGGTVSHIDGIGVERFVRECERLARDHGPRFAPPKILRDMAEGGRRFYAA